MRWTLTGVVILMLLGVSAAAAPAVDLTGDGVSTKGLSRAVASQGAFQALDLPTDLRITLQADRLEGVVDVEEQVGAVLVATPTEQRTEPVALDWVRSTTIQLDRSQELDVLPLANPAAQQPSTLEIEALAMSLGPGTRGIWVNHFTTSGRDTMGVPAEGSVEVGAAATVTITGNFMLVSYGWTLDLETAQGDVTLQTGFRREQAHPALNETFLTVGTSTSRQAYLEVHNGTLRFENVPAAALVALAPAWDFSVDGTLHIQNPVGSVADTNLDTDTLDLAGHLEGQVVAVDSRVGVTLSGTLDSASTPAGTLTASTPNPGGLTWLWLAGFVVMLAVLAFLLRVRVQSILMDRMETRHGNGEFVRALRLAKILRLTRAFRHDAAVVAVESLVELGRPAQAWSWLKRSWGRNDALRDYLAAVVHTAQGNVTEARRRLSAAVVQEPAFIPEAEQHPLLRTLAARPRDDSGAYA